ncbi:MAG: acetoin dehydrogenase dihydrolipoyllysine-residue acetyltransferase subunit [Pseudomonadota bacterium]
MSAIEPVKMPKWGLAMEEGKIVEWWAKEGDAVSEGDDLVDIETSKITNVCEAHAGGVLARIVAQPEETLPVGALIAVLAEPDVADADVDAFIADYQANFDPGEASAEAAGPEIRSVEVYGRTMRVGVMGEGEAGTPVVLLHGFGGDLNNWMLVQPALAETRPVYAIELPGHGQSTKDVADGKLGTLATGLVAAMEALGLERFVLVGHSLGGALAVECASRLGDRVAALGLVCPAALPGGAVNGDYLDAFVAARRARDLREPAKLLFADPEMVSRDMLEDLIRAKRLDGAEAALGAIKDGLKGDDPDYAGLGDKLGGLGCPVLVLASQSDQIVGAPDAGALPAGATLQWIEGAGHMPHLEKSGEVVTAIARLG